MVRLLLIFLSGLIGLAGCAPSGSAQKLVLVTGADPEHFYLEKQVRFLIEVLETLDYDLEVQRHQSARCLELSNSGQVDGELWRIRGLDAEFTNLIRVPTGIWAHPELAFVKGNIELDGWNSLSPYRVAYRKGTKVVENNIQGIVENQVPVDVIEEAFGLLAEGNVDVVISDNIDGTLLLASDAYPALFTNFGRSRVQAGLRSPEVAVKRWIGAKPSFSSVIRFISSLTGLFRFHGNTTVRSRTVRACSGV